MSTFTITSVPGSPFGRAVLAALEEKGTRYRFEALAPGGGRSEAHLARHPFGRVPVLVHDSFVLYETQAILRYVDRVLPTPPLTPADPRAAARMDQVMNICDWYLFQGVSNVIAFQRIIGPRLLGLRTDMDAIIAAMPKAHTVFAELSRLLGRQPYFAGDGPSLADILAAAHLDFLAATPEWAPLTADRTNLVAWLERMNQRASFQATTWERVAQLGKAA